MDSVIGILDTPVKGVVIEWMFSILPLIIVEIVMIWIPSIRKPHIQSLT